MSPLSRAGATGLLLLLLATTTPAASDTFLYAGCSPSKCTPGSQYDSNLNSLLTSLVSAASFSSSFSNLTVGAAHGLYQCRPDTPDCSACVSSCASQLSAACPYSLAAALRLDGCYVRYANASFLGVEDKTPVLKKCGLGQLDSSSGQMASRDSVLGYLLTSGAGQLFRASGEGDVKGVAECVAGLSPAQCQDCLGEAIGLLKTECWYASSGDVFLATCYARYAVAVSHTASIPKPDSSTNAIGTQKTLAIIIGVIAIVGLVVIIAVFIKKYSKEDGSSHHHHDHK